MSLTGPSELIILSASVVAGLDKPGDNIPI
jgi:hypothetical protein